MIKKSLFGLRLDNLVSDDVIERAKTTKAALEQLGFTETSDPRKLIGRTLATNVGTFHCGAMMYRIADLVEEEGYKVVQEDGVVFTSEDIINPDGKVYGTRVQGLELFLPFDILSVIDDSAMDAGFIYVGDMPEIHELGEDHFKNPYGSKEYFDEEWIRQNDPDMYKRIVQKIRTTKANVGAIGAKLRAVAEEKGINVVDVETRIKSVAGAYAWIQKIPDKRDPEMLWDVNGVRLIVQTPDECYRAMHIAHDICPAWYVRDMIAVPKPNGFQSIGLKHQDTVHSLEIQIQTPAMRNRAVDDDYRVSNDGE